MAVIGDLLFYRRDGVDLDAVIRHHNSRGLQDAVDALPGQTFKHLSDDQIADQMAEKLRIEPLELDVENAVPNVQETQVEVGDDYGFGRGRIRVSGLRATKAIPFKGDPDLWSLRTNPYDLNPPRGQVRGQSVAVGMEVAAQQGDTAAQYIDAAIKSIAEYLKRQEAQLKPFNEGLKANALPMIQQRRARLGNASDLLKKLGG